MPTQHQLAETTNFCIDAKKRFGIVGAAGFTGLTDYSAQLQLAIDSIALEGKAGTILLPNGVIYASQIKMRHGVTIRGMSNANISVGTTLYTTENAPLIMLDPVAAYVVSFRLENIGLRGNLTGSLQDLLNVQFDPASTLKRACNRLTLDRVMILQAGGYGIRLEGLAPFETGINAGYIQQFSAVDGSISSCVLGSIKATGVILESGIKGMEIVKGGDGTNPNIVLSSDVALVSNPNVGPYRFKIERSFINNPNATSSGTHVSIYAKDTQQLTITDIDFEHCNTAVKIDGTSSYTTMIANSKIVPTQYTCPALIDIVGCNGLTVDNVQFVQAGTSTVQNVIRYSGSQEFIKNVDIRPSCTFPLIDVPKITYDKYQSVDATGRVVFYRKLLIADTNSAAVTDDIDIITDAVSTTSVRGFYDGKEVIIHPFYTGRELVIRDASVSGGNIQTRGATSARLRLTRHNVVLRFKESTQMWVEVGRTDDSRPSTRLSDCTWATRPTAATYPGYEVFITDVGINGGSSWKSDGVNWRPLNGSIILTKLVTPLTSVADATEQRLLLTTIQTGMLVAGMTLELTMGGIKSAAVQTINMSVRMGSANTNAGDVQLTAGLSLVAGNQAFGMHFKYSWASDTTVRTDGNSGAAGTAVNSFAQVNGSAQRTSTMAASMAANPMYFCFTSQNITGSPTETLLLNYFKLELVG